MKGKMRKGLKPVLDTLCNDVRSGQDYQGKTYYYLCGRRKGHSGFHESLHAPVIWLDSWGEPEEIEDYIHWLETKVMAGKSLATSVGWSLEDMAKEISDGGSLKDFHSHLDILQNDLTEYRRKTCEHEFVDPTNKVVKGEGWKVCTKCGLLKESKKDE